MTIQTEIIGALNVSVSLEARRETVGRTRFLSDYMERSAKLIGKVPTADLDDGAPLRPLLPAIDTGLPAERFPMGLSVELDA